MLQLLHPADCPAWLNDMKRDLTYATTNHNDENGTIAVRRITAELYPQMTNHDWSVSSASEKSGLDFDSIFEKYRSECRIPELFDQLIHQLQEIVLSGLIDSVRAVSELQEVISTLRRSKNGSYFATRGAWFFAATWLKNSGWELLSSIPVAGPVIRGLQKTFEETDTQMNKMHDSIQGHVENKIASNFPRLEYKLSEFLKVRDDRSKHKEDE